MERLFPWAALWSLGVLKRCRSVLERAPRDGLQRAWANAAELRGAFGRAGELYPALLQMAEHLS
jgi:hypothetical protein